MTFVTKHIVTETKVISYVSAVKVVSFTERVVLTAVLEFTMNGIYLKAASRCLATKTFHVITEWDQVPISTGRRSESNVVLYS